MADPDQFVRPYQLTKTMHRGLYPAIDPKRPELSAAGKVVIITGAGGGVGYDVATAWAIAGAAGIVLVGRNTDSLDAAAQNVKSVNKDVPTLVQKADIASEADVQALYEAVKRNFSKADVLVNSAGVLSLGKIGEAEPAAWWKDFEINIKGTFLTTHFFIKFFGGKGTIVNIVSFAAFFTIPGYSPYNISKLAQVKLGEFTAAEYPEIRVFSVNPGTVEKTEGRGMLVDDFKAFAKDTGIASGGLSLYLSTSRADHLRGGLVSVNWDVDEMEAHKSEIADKELLKIAILNAKLSPEGHPWET